MTEHDPSMPPPTPSIPPASRPARPGGAINPGPVQYKGGELDPERGPGLGCFWFQAILLVVLIVLTPIGVVAGWPSELSAVLLFVVIGLLLLTGQTVIFLLRLVAADRRGRRRPLGSASRTVGEIEAGTVASPPAESATVASPSAEPGLPPPAGSPAEGPPVEGPPAEGPPAEGPPTA